MGVFIGAQVVSLLGEAWLATRSGRKRLGYPLAGDQRVRMALWYTVVTGVLVTAIVVGATFKMQEALPGLAAISLTAKLALTVAGRGAPVIVGAGLVFFAALVLLRYLLLTLLNPRR
jgi:hypothetical protein